MDRSNIRDDILCISVDNLLSEIKEIQIDRFNISIIFENGKIWEYERRIRNG